MAISITGKINKAASKFKAGESFGFGVRLGVKFYNRETKLQEWTNYEAVIFAKQMSQVDFYERTLVAGAVIEVSGSGCQVKTFNGNNGPVTSISILDGKLGYVGMSAEPEQQQQQQQQHPQQQQYAPQQQQYAPPSQQHAPQQAPQQSNFDSDIPF
jgi:single-strand DNA-binding protein